METVKLFYALGALAFILLFPLNGMIARAVLPPKLLVDLRRRKWAGVELAIAIAPGVVIVIVGLFALQLYFWFPFCALLLAMLVSGLIMWAVGKIWPSLSLLQKSGVLFAVYVAVPLVLVAVPWMPEAWATWMHARASILLATGLSLVMVLYLVLMAAGAFLIVAVATAYFAVAGEITRAVLLPLVAARTVAAPALTVGQPPPASARPAPQEVQLAVALIYSALALGGVKLALDFRFYLSMGLGFVLLINAMGVGLVILLAVLIGRGANWARVSYLVLFALSLPLFLLTGPGEFARSRLVFLVSVAQIGMQIYALHLLLQRRVATYFRA